MTAGGAAPRGPGTRPAPPGPHPDLLAGATIVTHEAPGAPGPAARASGAANATSEAAPPAAPPARGLPGDWQRLRAWGGGLLVLLCFGLFGWQAWRGRDPAPVAVRPLAPGAAAELKVHVAGAVATPGVYRLAQGDRVEDAIRAAGGLAPDADAARLNLAQRVRDEQRLDVPFLHLAPDAAQAAPGHPGQPCCPGNPPAAPPGGGEAQPPAPAGGPASAPRPAATARPTGTPRPAPRSSAPRPSATARPTAFSGGKVNVNTATLAELEQLPGLGDVSARRIVAYREANGRLTGLDDLRKAGVGEAIIRRAAEYLAFDAP